MRVMVILQVIAALGLLNVWLLRFDRPSAFRGGDANSMRAEFATYGLPVWFAYLVGTLKVGSAIALLIGIWRPAVVLPAATLVSVLMIGALAMHAKIRDPLAKFLPALAMLALGICIAWGAAR